MNLTPAMGDESSMCSAASLVCYARLIIPLVIAMQGSCFVLMTIDVLKSRKPLLLEYEYLLLVMLIRKGDKNVAKGR
jgi:hypothetical protein